MIEPARRHRAERLLLNQVSNQTFVAGLHPHEKPKNRPHPHPHPLAAQELRYISSGPRMIPQPLLNSLPGEIPTRDYFQQPKHCRAKNNQTSGDATGQICQQKHTNKKKIRVGGHRLSANEFGSSHLLLRNRECTEAFFHL